MKIKMTLVHGSDDVEVTTFDSLGSAHAYVTVAENMRHGTEGRTLSELFPAFERVSPSGEEQQFGTDYHYVMFEQA